ncbi:MAG: DNA glycosylase AlkZ-like family protein [Christensenellales bacterium]
MTARELLLATLERQYLLHKGDRLTVMADLCGLQAQFAGNPRLALQLRAQDFHPDTWQEGLVKVWTHRNTLHAVRRDELGLYLSAKDQAGPWEDSWWGVPKAVKPYWSEVIREQVAAGNDTREGLKAACRARGMDEPLVQRVFHGWGGLIKEMAMADRGLIAYAMGTDKRFVLPGPVNWMDRDAARLTLLARYFTHFGPATLADCAAFTGYGVTETRRLVGLGALPLREVDCGGARCFYLGALAQSRGLPACVLLAGFDQVLLGYRDRGRVMRREDQPKVITCSGIVFPTILLNGRLRARYKVVAGGVQVTPFEPLSDRAQGLIRAQAARSLGKNCQVAFLPPLT